MSDFLDNLLSRGTGAGEAVQPRPVSLYEPPGTAWAAGACARTAADLEQEETSRARQPVE
jgi:hypothetical protein